MGCLPWSGDRTNDHHREGIFLSLEGMHARLLSNVARAYVVQDAAFSLWADWASVYPPQSPERELLESVRKEKWLVSIVHHDYIHTDSLWDFLSDL